jgi:hypothetical protein
MKMDKSASWELYSLTRSPIGDKEKPFSIPGCREPASIVFVVMLRKGRTGMGARDGEGGAS